MNVYEAFGLLLVIGMVAMLLVAARALGADERAAKRTADPAVDPAVDRAVDRAVEPKETKEDENSHA